MSIHRKFEPPDEQESRSSVIRHRSAASAAAPTAPAAPRRAWFERVRQWLANASARRSLLRCHELDPRLARDIGITDTDLLRERHAPFWRPVRRW